MAKHLDEAVCCLGYSKDLSMSNSRVPNKEVERTGRVGDVMYSGVMWSMPTSNMEGSEPSPDCVVGTKVGDPWAYAGWKGRIQYGGQVSHPRPFKLQNSHTRFVTCSFDLLTLPRFQIISLALFLTSA